MLKKVTPKSGHSSFYLKIKYLKMAKKSPDILATFALKFVAKNF